MTLRQTWIRIAAALLPAALLMHEAVYAVAGARDGGSHGYLATALPLLAVVAGSLVLAALLGPSLRGRTDEPGGAHAAALRPLVIAGALIALFAVQEAAEIALLGGGPVQLATVLAGSWLLLPLALGLGALGAAFVEVLERAGESIARHLGADRARRSHRSASRPSIGTSARRRQICPLAFGLARRPPPVRA